MNTKCTRPAQVKPQHAVLEMWAIKHTPTGMFLPAPRGRGGRGGTHVELGEDGPPRLFAKASAARVALRYWLAGAISVGQYLNHNDDYDEDWRTEPKPHRVAEDMEVVPVTIAERKAE